jgi:hypothetical protein
MWIGDAAYRQPAKVSLFFERLREMGINTGLVHGEASFEPLVTNHFPYYVENMVNRGLCLKYNSSVKDWNGFVTAWAQTRTTNAFIRDYSLDDPAWKRWANSQMTRLVERHRGNHPFAYDIRDELSITTSANPFDYDFSAVTLSAFRKWLQRQYPSLEALNLEWQTSFLSWEEVRPFTTDQIKSRMASGEALPRGAPDWQLLRRLRFDPGAEYEAPTRWNFAPWADFRTYLDRSLAETLAELRMTAHAADPATPVGIEGTQMPSAFGGYDLWRLAQALDWIEPYDIGNAREILGSFMENKLIMTTVFESDTAAARRRLWHLLLEGDRGCIVWFSDDCIDLQSPNYALTKKAEALAPVLKEMTSPLAALFLQARRLWDPIAIHYSQPSIQVDWLLESTVDGASWHRRFSSFEAEHNRMAKVRNSWLKAFQDLGYSPRFVSSEQIEQGILEKENFRALVLPDSLALSQKEGAALQRFLKDDGGHRIFADGTPGIFNEHGRIGQHNPVFGTHSRESETESSVTTRTGSMSRSGDIAQFESDRLKGSSTMEWPRWIGSFMTNSPREVQVQPEARVRVHRYKLGPARLLALERNVQYRMSEDLKKQGPNPFVDQSVSLEVRLAGRAHIYDLRTSRYLGKAASLTVTVSPREPTLLAMVDQLLKPGDVVAQLRAGSTGSEP